MEMISCPMMSVLKWKIEETVNGRLKDEEGEASDGNVLFSRENPMVINKHLLIRKCL